jgi:hypothetical protein
MKTVKKCLLYCLLLFPLLVWGQTTTFRNVGKMHVGNGFSGNPSLYIPDSQLLTDSSSIKLSGTVRLDGNLLAGNLISETHGFDLTGTSGKLLMKGDSRQHITTNDPNYDRTTNYLDGIPVLEIENRTGVHLSDSMSLTVDTLNLLKGKFILGSSYIDGAETRLAHFLVNDSVKYTRTPQDTAVVEIEIVLGNVDAARDRVRKVLGFSSPFKKMFADYFTYNYLIAPDEHGLFGDSERTITWPGYALETGRGYLIGQNVYDLYHHADYYWMAPQWHLSEATYPYRMRDTLLLNRYSLEGIHIVDTQDYPITAPDAYTGESLNTGDVTVHLKAGYNYLGNPYTCPLDLSALKDNVLAADAASDAWGVSRDALLENVDIYAGFWILHEGKVIKDNLGVAQDPNHTELTFSISVNYQISQKEGSTVNTDSIPPMQVFVVYAYNDCNLTIPASARTHRNTNFLKSGNVITDELLLEVRDQTTEGFDRMCVVFRNHAFVNSTDTYDAYKLINKSKGVSQIYTTSPDKTDLITSVISPNEAFLPVTLIPSAIEQEVELTASRLETLVSPEAVQIEDLKTGDIVDLTKQSYRFTTSPEDNPNRFVLHFKDMLTQSTNVGALCATPFSQPRITYISNEITLTDLQKEDAGSRITITDVQGRILLNETLPANVGETGKANYRLMLSSGIYVASLSGNRSLTIKFTGR